jgi:uncharacterized membrane protein YkvA (DUF1232 family)
MNCSYFIKPCRFSGATLVTKMSAQWKQLIRQLRVEIHTLYFACRDPHTPWYAKALAGVVVAYAFSPIDLIPDPIPILGQLDDLLLLPLGVLAVRTMIPTEVLDECRVKAHSLLDEPKNWFAAVLIIALWLTIAVLGSLWAIRFFTE